jgi:hypothetical protein
VGGWGGEELMEDKETGFGNNAKVKVKVNVKVKEQQTCVTNLYALPEAFAVNGEWSAYPISEAADDGKRSRP